MSIAEAIGILEHLDTPVLEVVLDQTRIAYRVQEAVKASARSTNAPAAACNTTAPAPTDLKANQPTEHEK